MKFLLTVTLFCFAFIGLSQSSNFNSQKEWSKNKKEIMFQAGATQFLGDLGGRDRIGKDYSLADINFPSTNINLGIGYRYRFHPRFATTTLLNVGMLKGDDALTNEPIRKERNLSFRSPIVNLSQRIEWIVFANEKVGKRYNIKGNKGMKFHNEQFYVFGGVGIAYFNPQANYNGSWVNLRPLSTEGQGLANGPKKYLPITATIPAGVGFRMGISQMWRIGIEASYIKTFSDYIDDVSGVYYDPAALSTQVSPTSAALSNRSPNNPDWFSAGEQRGDITDKDAFFFLNLTVSKNITYVNKNARYKVKKYKYTRSKF